ncbi:MAG TPA: hypothetical protein ENI90_02880 [Methylothermaceae bacterium]|nr:hypothetical protein [Methylothermaceae bacterium]
MARFFIGWDVGGWHCDHNPTSRDALVILDEERRQVGLSWRGNLRSTINTCTTPRAWLETLFHLCQTEFSGSPTILSIDIPLAFPQAFTRLITKSQPTAVPGPAGENPYLFRRCERLLFRHGLRPLSPVKDMIGSQATKGIHVLARYAPLPQSCGVWRDGTDRLTVIEAYPAGCKGSRLMRSLLAQSGVTTPLPSQDERDALVCALTGWLFVRNRQSLLEPPDDSPLQEGWIWLPKDVLDPG